MAILSTLPLLFVEQVFVLLESCMLINMIGETERHLLDSVVRIVWTAEC